MKSIDELKEGEILNSIFYRRMITSNQNILIAVCGKTGSGKSYACISMCDSWYQKYFGMSFPIENICFSIESVMERLVHGNLRKGELLIFEESGTSMSNLEYQNKLCKLFTYVLQSFRNRNVGIIFNLPYFSMLNKTTRMLMHILIQTQEIKKNKCILKPLHLQWSQYGDKCYQHFPRIMIDGGYEMIEFISYSKPPTSLCDPYELKKKSFVDNLSEDVLENAKRGNKIPFTELQEQIDACFKEGITNHQEIADRLNKIRQHITQNIGYMRRKGWKEKARVQSAPAVT
jgi:ABC-type dipeptide/oligopeptide/nickel transport system ATPase component